MTSFPSGCTLIGLPGSGKSTVGIQLAKAIVRPFVDTDIELQRTIGMSLQQYLDRFGVEALREVEAECVCALELAGYVVATGGSVVYSEDAMTSLKSQSKIIYLEVSFATMTDRLGDYGDRGIAADVSSGLERMFEERVRLYEHFADVTVDANQSVPAVLENVLQELKAF